LLPVTLTSAAATYSALSSLPAYSITSPAIVERAACSLIDTPRHTPAALSPAAVNTTGASAVPCTTSFAGS
jgi:hypothetical protein